MKRASQEYVLALRLMGRVVIVTKELDRVLDATDVRWEKNERQPRPGWVTGVRWLQEGTYHQGYGEEPSYLEQRGNVPCLLVAFWSTMKSVRVPFDGYRLLPGEVPYPPRYAPGEWSEKQREQLRSEMQDYPRDKQGRWVQARYDAKTGQYEPI